VTPPWGATAAIQDVAFASKAGDEMSAPSAVTDAGASCQLVIGMTEVAEGGEDIVGRL
jgi:hypothetical protein